MVAGPEPAPGGAGSSVVAMQGTSIRKPSRIRSTARLAAGLLSTRWTGRPLLLSHLVTCRCPCRCATCLWRDLVEDELTAEEIAWVYRDAAAVGCRVCSIWGGEPLVRLDLPRILRSARHANLNTILITNAAQLPRRAGEIAPYVNGMILSLDHPSPQHDRMRGLPGLFDAVLASIDLLHSRHPQVRVVLNTVISTLNASAVLELARLARDLRTDIYFHPIETGTRNADGLVATKQSLAVSPATLSDLFAELRRRKRAGWPIRNSENYLRTFIAGRSQYRCHARKVALELRPNGDLVDCLDRTTAVANLRQTRLTTLLADPNIQRRRMAPTTCNTCVNANVIDTSYVWELRWESLLALARVHLAR